MASRSALTEEGRTRIRNFQGRLLSYLVLWVVIGIGLVIGVIWVKTRYGYLPLQGLYLSQYIKASIKSFVPHKQPSRFTLLVRVIDDNASGQGRIVACTDDQVTPIRDENGRVRFDPKLGPFFRLHDGIPHKYFYWTSIVQSDSEMYAWMRSNIYNGHSLIGLYWICFTPLPLVVIGGMILSVKLDVNINREYEEGNLVRGVRLLKSTEYGREMRQTSGLGLPVFKPGRGQQ